MKALLLRFIGWLKPQTSRSPWQHLLAQVLKYGIMVAAAGYIWWRLDREEQSLRDVLFAMDRSSWLLVIASCLLIPVNLAWEAAKWRSMVRKVYPDLRYKTAYEAVLVGITAGIFTPNGIGAYAGRVFWLRAGRRLEAAILTLGDRLCQMTITIWTALFALEVLVLLELSFLGYLNQTVLQTGRLLLWACGLFALFVSFFPGTMYRLLLMIGAEGKLTSRIAKTLKAVDRHLLLNVLALGFGRYLTFCSQYILLLYAFGYQQGVLLAAALIALVFFFKSLLPSISFSELGVRESIALTIMGAAGIAPTTAVTATFLLYVYNQIIPALAGLLLTPRLKTDI
jgi:uncharacterized membrane protein YbhN (UPF0104 family)